MPGFLSRFRRRATSLSHSTTTTTSSQPQPPTPASTHTPVPLITTPLERKIHPDLDSLLASHSLQQSGHTSLDGTLGTVVEARTGDAEPGSSSGAAIALRSSTRRHSIDGSGFTLPQSNVNLHLTPPRRLDGLPESVPVTPASSSRPSSSSRPTTSTTDPLPRQDQNVPTTATRPRNRHLLTNLAVTGEWSTFGRGGAREQPEPRLSLGNFAELGTAPGERDSSASPSRIPEGENAGGASGEESANAHSQSTFTPPQPARAASPHTSTPMSTPSNSQPTSRATSHSHHASSNTHPQTPGYPQTPTSHNSHSQSDPASFSPHTFGYPTPPVPHTHLATPSHGSSGFTFGLHSPSSSPSSPLGSLSRHEYGTPPPPLPPLDHPAFRLSHAATIFPDVTFPASQSPDPPTRASSTTHPSAQARPISRSRSTSRSKSKHPHLSSSSSMPSLSRRRYSTKSSTSKSIPTRTTRPFAQDIFLPPFYNSSSVSAAQQYHENPSTIAGDRANTIPVRRSRARTRSTSDNIRRTSAEFSAHQASSAGNIGGVTTATGSWEAQVSREMVRISLGTGRGESGDGGGNGNYPATQTIEKGGEGNNGNRADEVAGSGDSYQGVTRGNNQQGQTQEGLGSPFLLQDTDTKKSNLSDIARTFYDLFGIGAVTTGKDKGKGKDKEKTVDIGMSQDTDTKKEDTDTTKVPVVKKGVKGKSKSASKSRTPSPPKPTPDPHALAISSTPFLQTPALSVTAPTPEASPSSPSRSARRTASEPASVLRTSGEGKAKGTGKRKADDVEGTPPDTKKEQRATFALDPKPNRASPSSGSSHGHAPSSYHRKRARLTTSTSLPDHSHTAANTGSWSSRGSQTPQSGQRPTSRGSATRAASTIATSHRAPSRRSISQVSIPISALISPHAPSLSRSSTFHMRDPRRPAPIQPTPWSLHFPSAAAGEAGSPVHAWLFFVGFLVFPLWWIAGFLLPIPRTRKVGESEVEKGVVLDDPQVEFDAKSWRTRCRVVSVVSLVTYIPFIVLVAIFA